jgi:uncharacterized protein YhfF
MMTDDLKQDPQIQQYWKAYARSANLNTIEFMVFAFGDNEESADTLSELVVFGPKRATAYLPRDFEAFGQPLPKPGDFSVVVDGRNKPRCIIRTTQVEIKPLRDVDERFAWDEGEGDRSLEGWMSGHIQYFKRQGAREGFSVDDSIEVVLERFEVVWPPESVDARSQTATWTI